MRGEGTSSPSLTFFDALGNIGSSGRRQKDRFTEQVMYAACSVYRHINHKPVALCVPPRRCLQNDTSSFGMSLALRNKSTAVIGGKYAV